MRTIFRDNYTPNLSDYHEKIVVDEAQGKQWLFDCDGVFTDITGGAVDITQEKGQSTTLAVSQKLFTDEVNKLEEDVATAGENASQALSEASEALSTASDVSTAVSNLTTALESETEARSNADTALGNRVTAIENKIPAQASSSNQLADKDFVNSSVATNTANFKGTFNTIEELEAVQDPTNNDYGFVIGTDQQGNTVYNRYKYNGTAWVFEYALNNSSFTASQWASINSGVTTADVSKLAGIEAGAEANVNADWNATSGDAQILNKPDLSVYATNTALTTGLATKQDTISDLATIRSGAAAGATAVQPGDLATVATSGSYNDLSNKPTIPTVNNSTITITNNGTTVDSFTTNASSAKTIALTSPVITMTTTDPGEGTSLAANHFIGVYS